MNQITASELNKHITALLGVGIETLAEVHIARGAITFVTQPSPVTGNTDAGTVYIVPDPEPEPEEAVVVEEKDHDGAQ